MTYINAKYVLTKAQLGLSMPLFSPIFHFLLLSPTITVGLSSRPSLSLARFSFCFCLIYYPMHCNYIIYIVFYELYSIHYILENCILIILFWKLHVMHDILCFALYAFHSLECILFLKFSAVYLIHILFNAFHWVTYTVSIF